MHHYYLFVFSCIVFYWLYEQVSEVTIAAREDDSVITIVGITTRFCSFRMTLILCFSLCGVSKLTVHQLLNICYAFNIITVVKSAE